MGGTKVQRTVSALVPYSQYNVEGPFTRSDDGNTGTVCVCVCVCVYCIVVVYCRHIEYYISSSRVAQHAESISTSGVVAPDISH